MLGRAKEQDDMEQPLITSVTYSTSEAQSHSHGRAQ